MPMSMYCTICHMLKLTELTKTLLGASVLQGDSSVGAQAKRLAKCALLSLRQRKSRLDLERPSFPRSRPLVKDGIWRSAAMVEGHPPSAGIVTRMHRGASASLALKTSRPGEKTGVVMDDAPRHVSTTELTQQYGKHSRISAKNPIVAWNGAARRKATNSTNLRSGQQHEG